MSVLINMEMPKSCNACMFDEYGLCLINKNLEGKDELTHSCPLIEVPPHGDLIDAQEEMRLMQSCEYDTYDDYNRAFDMLDNAPTIIPADKDGET